MKSSIFHDFDAYAEELKHADMKSMMQERLRSCWEIHLDSFGEFEFQIGIEGSGIITEGAGHSAGLSVFVPLGEPRVHSANGHVLSNDSLFIVEPGADFCLASSANNQWCSLYIPLSCIESLSPGFVPTHHSLVLRAHDSEGKQLRKLLHRLAHAISTRPCIFEEEETTDAVVKELQESLLCLFHDNSSGPPSVGGRPAYSRHEVIRRANDCLAAAGEKSLSIQQFAHACGVSERTLREVFKQCFGVSPLRYLQIRQLHQVRRSLLTDRDIRKVSDALTRHGTWEFGRFARRYRDFFGELPSETFRRVDQ